MREPGDIICDICGYESIISDPQMYTFEDKFQKSICKDCWNTVFNSTSWGYKRQTRIIITYHKVSIPHKLKWQVWQRDNFTCQECGGREDLTIDHVHPEKLGGKLTEDNLRTLCRICNSEKGARIDG